MNTSRKGTLKELRTAAILEAEGWLVASRRHVGGAGDLLAIKPGEVPRLIEVKARRNLYEGFRRVDRVALRDEAERYGCVAEVAWWRTGARTHELIPEAEWPT